jgi:HD-GYP domain-containing protein (c-di-GMP phosphodiesterase class II)
VGTAAVLTRAIEARDPFAVGHAARVAALSQPVARRLGLRGADVDQLALAARLHDVGKLLVSSRVLLKPGALDSVEMEEIRAHPGFGVSLIDWCDDYTAVLEVVRHHHERWDGGGYPFGLAGEEIPLGARILAPVDAFDAMTSDRAYRHATSARRAIAELVRCSGSQFDPRVVEAVVEAWHARELSRLGRRALAATG